MKGLRINRLPYTRIIQLCLAATAQFMPSRGTTHLHRPWISRSVVARVEKGEAPGDLPNNGCEHGAAGMQSHGSRPIVVSYFKLKWSAIIVTGQHLVHGKVARSLQAGNQVMLHGPKHCVNDVIMLCIGPRQLPWRSDQGVKP